MLKLKWVRANAELALKVVVQAKTEPESRVQHRRLWQTLRLNKYPMFSCSVVCP